MIKKRKKEEIDVDNINTEVIKYFYNKELNTNINEFKPSYINLEKCDEDTNAEDRNIKDNFRRLKELREKETIKIDIKSINVNVIEFVINLYKEDILQTITEKKSKKIKKDKKKKNEETSFVNVEDFYNDTEDSFNESKDFYDDTKDLYDKQADIYFDTEYLDEENIDITNLTTENAGQEDRVWNISQDKRYLFFLKKTKPTILKNCENIEDYINRIENMSEEKGKINQAIQDTHIEETIIKKHPKRLDYIKESFWSKDEISKFKFLVQKYKNDFVSIKKAMSNRSMSDIILRYYYNKDKTYNYIKKKAGRISDSEVNLIIENEWTDLEMNIFNDKYKLFGNNLNKYKEFLCKSNKDLKIFLRWYIKNNTKKKPNSTTILNDWSIDERQIFAIYFPYYNKNWITMSAHFSTKSSKDLKIYYTKYYKFLSYNEQKFEASLVDYKLISRTDPVIHKGKDDDDWNSTVGWLSK